MGQKGVLLAWISVSKDMLRNYGTKGLINILVGQYIQDQTGYIQDTFVQDTFWTRTGLYTRQNIGHHILHTHILGQRQGQDTKQFWS